MNITRRASFRATIGAVGAYLFAPLVSQASNTNTSIGETPRILDCDSAIQWVSVEKQLPEEGEYVLVVVGKSYVKEAEYNYKFESWGDRANWLVPGITHWAKMPAPPPWDLALFRRVVRKSRESRERHKQATK